MEVCDGVQSRLVTQDIFGFLEQALADDSIIDSTELPFDFAGGFVGYFGYERMALTAGVTGKPSRHPDACWIEADSFLAIDHLEQRSYLVYIDADLLVVTAWLDEMTARSHGNIDRRYGQTGGTGN